jgi:hypothetical protein
VQITADESVAVCKLHQPRDVNAATVGAKTVVLLAMP